MNRTILIVLFAAAVAAAAPLAAQTTYDPATGLSDQNPGGPWRYVGWNPTANGFTQIGYYNLNFVYTEDWIGMGVPAWYFNEGTKCPAIAANTTGADAAYLTSFVLRDGMIMMHPDSYTAQLLYFTAPQTGYYDISAVMTATDVNNTAADLSDGKDGPAAAVYRWTYGNDPEYGGGFSEDKKVAEALLPIIGDNLSYSATGEFLSAGDVVAFMVYPDGDGDGNWADFSCDAVECEIDITRVSDATLDLTWGLENGDFEAPTLASPAVIVPEGWYKMPSASDIFGMYTANPNLPGGAAAEGNQTFFLDTRSHVSGTGGDVFQCVGALDDQADVTLSLTVGGAPETLCAPGDYEVGLWTDTDADGLPDTPLATVAGTPTANIYEPLSVTAEDVAAGIPVFVRLSLPPTEGGFRQTFFDDLELTVSTGGPVLEGDLDGDGLVGSADLDIVRANWGSTVTPGDLTMGDASGDGSVGSADLDIVRANWGATAAAAVPEPGIYAIMLLATLAALTRRKWLNRGKRHKGRRCHIVGRRNVSNHASPHCPSRRAVAAPHLCLMPYAFLSPVPNSQSLDPQSCSAEHLPWLNSWS